MIEPSDRWVGTGLSGGQARRNAFRRDPRQWLRSRAARRRGLSEQHPVPTSRAEVLARLVELPVSTWTYGWDHETVKHLGPMAQDFATAFGLGDTNQQIAFVDATGVLMASVQALHARVVELEAEVASLRRDPLA